jgi:hypothetical protein
MEIRKTPITKTNPYYEWTLLESVDFLKDILKEFPFGDWKTVVPEDGSEPYQQSRSQAVQIASMLSLFCMAMMPKGANRMGFIYNANSQRSGKTLLAKLSIMTVCGAFKAQPWKNNDEELNKLLDAEVLAGSMYICFDNVRGFVTSQTLEGLMTSPQWTGRVLGRTQMFTAENRMNLFITGNDTMVSPDMGHRCLICDLFVEQGDVQERTVQNLIDEPWLMDLENRRNILSALWGIVRHWSEAGSPTASSFGYKPRLGFERWGEIIGGIVGFAGFGNPLEKVQLEQAGDSEERNIRRLLGGLRKLAIHDNYEEFTFQEIVTLSNDEGLFEYLMEGKMDNGNFKLSGKSASKLGLMLGKYAARTDGDRARPPRIFRKIKHFNVNEVEIIDDVSFGYKGEGRQRRYCISWK